MRLHLPSSRTRAFVDYVDKDVSPWLADGLSSILRGVQAQASLGGTLGMAALILTRWNLHATRKHLRPNLAFAPTGPTGWPAAIREALGAPVGFPAVLVIGAMLVVVFVTDVVLMGIRPYLTDLPAGRFAWKATQTAVTIGCDAVLLGDDLLRAAEGPRPWTSAFGGVLWRRRSGRRPLAAPVGPRRQAVSRLWRSRAPDGRDVLVLLRQRRRLSAAEFATRPVGRTRQRVSPPVITATFQPLPSPSPATNRRLVGRGGNACRRSLDPSSTVVLNFLT